MTESAASDTTVGEVQGTTTRHSSADSVYELDPRVIKARLFGDERGDRMQKQVIKARFLEHLQHPTGGLETHECDETATSPAVSGLPETPARIGRYAVLRQLGRGGMGVVYVAYDDDLDRKVAIKLLRGELSRDDRGRQRMLREAQALARLSHPNVVQVHEVGRWNDYDFVAMEYVDGQTLDQWSAETPRGWAEILEILTEAGRGLEAAHVAGLVHRDFKPANLLIGRDGRPRVLDFGLARAVTDSRESNPGGTPIADFVETSEQSILEPPSSLDLGASHTSAFDKMLTMTGALLGTPAYMAPEQHLGQPATALSDQFSFCVVLYEALFGQRPFRGSNRTEYAMRVTEGEFEAPPLNSGVPAWLRKVVMRGLSPRASDRWPSMSVLLGELRRDRTRTWRGAVIAVGLVAAFGVALAVSGDDARVCEADPRSVEDTWGDAEREAVRVAFAKTGMAESDAVLDHTWRSLDAYADEIVDARAEACEARWVARSQTDAQLELRTACLEQRERELAAVVGVLADADREVVLHAAELVAGLGDVGLCARVDLLEAGTPAPKDADAVAGIAEVRKLIADANAAREVGRIAEAKALTKAAWRAGNEVGFEPLLGELHVLEAHNSSYERDLDQAEFHAVEAIAIAQRHRNLELSAEGWLRLADLVGTKGANPDDRHEFKLAEVAVEQLGSPSRKASRLSLARALASRNAGLAEQSLVDFQLALESAEGFMGSEQLAATILAARSEVLASLGRSTEARADLERVTAILNEGSREKFDALFDLAVVKIDAGELEGAERDMERALEGYEGLFGPGFESIGHGHIALGKIALAANDVDAAEAAFARALEILHDEHDDHDWALDAIASLHQRRDHHARAIEVLNAAIEHRKARGRANDMRLGYLYTRLGTVYHDAGRLEDALVEFDSAVANLEQPGVDAPLDLAAALAGRGEIMLAQGQTELGAEQLERAVKLVPEDCGYPLLAGEVRLLLAEALKQLEIRQDHQRMLARSAFELLRDDPNNAILVERAQELMDPVNIPPPRE